MPKAAFTGSPHGPQLPPPCPGQGSHVLLAQVATPMSHAGEEPLHTVEASRVRGRGPHLGGVA